MARRLTPALALPLGLLGLILAAVVIGPLLSPYSPVEADGLRVNAALFGPGHLLGTDNQGRDMLARLLWGGRISLTVGLVPTIVATALGLGLGMISGLAGGVTDHVIMRVLDVFFAFPLVLLAIAIAGILQPGLIAETVSIAIVLIPYVGRLARTATLAVSTQPYVEAARALGAAPRHLLTRSILPNVLPPVLVYATSLAGLMMVVGAGLSFLGLGVQIPAADWGSMVSDGAVVLRRAPQVTLLPGLMIVLTALAFTLLGDALNARTERGRGGQGQP